jgi:hypothetical protein
MRVSFSVHEFGFCSCSVWVDSAMAFYQSEKFFCFKERLWNYPQSLIQRTSANITRTLSQNIVTLSMVFYLFFLQWAQANRVPILFFTCCHDISTYQDMKICLLDIQSSDNISTYSNMWICPYYRRLVSPFPVHHSKMRLPPKIPHTAIPLRQ